LTDKDIKKFISEVGDVLVQLLRIANYANIELKKLIQGESEGLMQLKFDILMEVELKMLIQESINEKATIMDETKLFLSVLYDKIDDGSHEIRQTLRTIAITPDPNRYKQDGLMHDLSTHIKTTLTHLLILCEDR